MAEILDRFAVVKALTRIIEEAGDQVWLISPYIKLNNNLKNDLLKHKNKKDFTLIVVYGKNDEDKRMSLSDEDLSFFKSFHQVQIRYHKRLHAKIYANDFNVLITSMNLHSYSINENIEVGILLKMNLLRDFGKFLTGNVFNDSIEMQARKFAEYIIDKSELQYEKYINKTSRFFGLLKTFSDTKIVVNKQRTGFCIRTRETISFNPHHPYNEPSFKSWNQFKNKDYKEKFCHSCGKPSQTSMNKPLCYDCYMKKD